MHAPLDPGGSAWSTLVVFRSGVSQPGIQRTMRLPIFTGSLAALLAGITVAAPSKAIIAGQRDTFQSGTSAFWSGGGGGPVIVETGGPDGAGDRFMQATSDGAGSGGRMSMYNREQWLGDYLTAGVTAIEMDLKNFGSQTLSMRVGFKLFSSPGSPGVVSRVPFSLPADGQWHRATFLLTLDAMQILGTPTGGYEGMLGGNAAEFRLLHATSATLTGNNIVSQLGVDNVTAIPAPASGMALGLSCLLLRRRR